MDLLISLAFGLASLLSGGVTADGGPGSIVIGSG
jgi:hypothetical protein